LKCHAYASELEQVLTAKEAIMIAGFIAALLVAQTSSVTTLNAVSNGGLDADKRCLLGVYGLPQGNSVTITGDNGQARGLRYTLSCPSSDNLRLLAV
jgi:uncharacterized protein